MSNNNNDDVQNSRPQKKPNDPQPGALSGTQNTSDMRAKLPAEVLGKFAGQIMVLGISGFRDQVGSEWAGRQITIRKAIENITSKNLGPNDTILPIRKDRYLIVFPDSNHAQATQTVKQIHDAVQRVLVGEDETNQIHIRTQVGKIEKRPSGQIVFKPRELDVPSQEEEKAERPRSTRVTQPAQFRGPDKSAFNASMQRLEDAHKQQDAYEIVYFPIWDIRHEVLIGYAVMPLVLKGTGEVFGAHQVLSPNATDRDFVELDIHLLQTQIEMAAEFHQNAFTSLLSSQLHYRTLSSPEGQREVMDIVSKIPPVLKRTLMLQVVGIPEGTPPSTVARRAGSLGNFVGALIIRIPRLDFPVADCVAMKATAVCYKVPEKLKRDEFLQKAASMIRKAQKAKLLTSFEYLPDVDMASDLKDAGAFFATGTFIGGPYEVPGNMKPMTIRQVRRGRFSTF